MGGVKKQQKLNVSIGIHVVGSIKTHTQTTVQSTWLCGIARAAWHCTCKKVVSIKNQLCSRVYYALQACGVERFGTSDEKQKFNNALTSYICIQL